MLKVAQSLPPILAASPNAGGLFCLIGGRSHLVRRESVTGLAADDHTLYCVVQEGGANEIRRTTRDGSTVVRLADGRLDLHDLFVDGDDLYAVYTETNEVVRLDDAFQVVERWRIPGDVDAVHINCITMLDGRLLATLFGQFSGHREYKGRTKRAGQVIDVRTGEVLIKALSQPHSILAADGLLYLCNSEKGELLVYRNYRRVKKAGFDGYTRGLAVDAKHVYVGLSASRNADINDDGHAQVVVLDRDTLAERGRIPLPCKEIYALMPLADGDLLQSVVVGLGEDLETCNKELEAIRGSMEQLASQAATAEAAQAEQGSALTGLNEARAQLEARLIALQDLISEKETRASGLNEQIQQRDGWLAELRTHADALTSLRAELESRLHAAEMEAGVLRADLSARDGRIDALQQVMAEKEQRLVDAAGLSAQHSNGLSELRTHADALTSLREELESRLHAAEMEVGVLRADLSARDSRIDALQQAIAEKEQRLAGAADRSAEQHNELSELRGQNGVLTSLRGEIEARLQAVDTEAGNLRAELAARHERLDALQRAMAEKEQLLAEAASRSAERDSALLELRMRVDVLASQRNDFQTQLQATSAEANFLRSELSGRDGRLQALEQVIAEKEQQLAGTRTQSTDQASLLAELKVRMEALGGLRVGLEHRVQALEVEADVLRQQALARSEHNDALQKLIGEYESRISELAGEVSAGAQRMARAESDLSTVSVELEKSRQQHAMQMETAEQAREEVDRRAGELCVSLETSEQRLEQCEAALAESQQAFRLSETRLQDVSSLLKLRHAELTRVLNSNSWKLSAPLRWVRNLLGAARRGRRPAAYADMLKTPASPEPYADHVGALPVAQWLANDGINQEAMPSEEVSPAAQVYLDCLFSGDVEQRAPEFVGPSDRRAPEAEELRAKLIAFYLPQFHPFPENDAWWGRGFTEWTNVTRALPQFLGHHQPQLPGELGFYDLRLPEVIRHQVELARQYGVHGFCFHYYWFAGHRLLERPLDLFLDNTDIDFPFCLCWANENWTRRWDGQDDDILIAQEHTPENDLAFIRDLVPYLRDSRYIRVNGKPLVIVYRPSILPDCSKTLMRWRDYCRDVGIGEIFLAMVQFDVEDPGIYGFDAAIEFPPHRLAAGFDAINHSLDIVNPDYEGHVVHYQSIVDSAKARPEPDYPLVRGVFPGWDNEARRPGRGYTFAFSTPDRYKDWLNSAVDYAETHPVGGEKIVMINAWNEWAEGAHLEPDRRYGHAFLHATREIVEKPMPARAAEAEAEAARRPRIVVVSHDAHPHGAQYLALHVMRELDEVFGFDVDLVVLGEGSLLADFARHATIHEAANISGDKAALEALAQRLHRGGAASAIANTTVAGGFVEALKRAGMQVVSLVHELPGLIASYGLERHAASIATHADHVVFAAPRVRDEFCKITTLPPDRAVVRPQGLFTRSRYLGKTDLGAARDALRDRLGIPRDSQVVLAVGYGDHRKGLDIFGEVAEQLMLRHDRLNFVWVGHFDQALMDAARERLAKAGVVERFHASDMDFDTDDYYAGADVYALTSREDPFPSVVLESLSVGLPVVAFSGAGGAEQLLRRGCGRLAKAGSPHAFAETVEDLLEDADTRSQLANVGRGIVASEFSFRRYVFDLLELAGSAPPRVSVVVPNYNYASLLHGRLGSIANQDIPVYEVIVLDDKSSDDSLEVLATLRGELGMDFEVIAAEENSGSVFKQWLKGVEKASGEYIWIAEADDLAEPTFLSTVLAAFRDDPSVVMSYCQSSAMDAEGNSLAGDYLAYTNDLSVERWIQAYSSSGDEEVRAGLAVKNTIPNVSAVVFRRNELLRTLQQGIQEIGGFRVAGDWMAYLMLLQHGRIAYFPQALNKHRRHERSVTTGSNYFAHLREVMQVQKFAREHYQLDPECVEKASCYAQTLYEQFELADSSAPRIEMNSELCSLLIPDSSPEGRAARSDAK